jgi:hypothetical protein
MAFLHDDILDNGLAALADADEIHILSQSPTTYADVATYTLGNAAAVVGSPSDRSPNGRKVTIGPHSNTGLVTADGTRTHWALIDTATSRLIATNAFASSAAVLNGNSFSVDAFDIGFPDGVSA